MVRNILLVVGGALTGALITLAAVEAIRIYSSDMFQTRTMSGPVAIITASEAKRGFLGATFSNEPSRWLFIADVSKAVPTDIPHIMVGDRLTTLNAQPITKSNEAIALLADKKPGDIVELGIVRDGQPINIKVTLLSAQEVYAALERTKGPSTPK